MHPFCQPDHMQHFVLLLTTMKLSSVLFSIILAVSFMLGFSACSGKSPSMYEYSLDGSTREAEVRTITVKSDSSIVSLPSYGMSSYCHADNCIYAYNYKNHAIDILDFDSDSISRSISFVAKGPGAVMPNPQGLKVFSPDTIAVYDFTAIKVMNGEGDIIRTIKLDKGSAPFIMTNCRSNISEFSIDFANNTVLYPAMDLATRKKYEVIKYDFVNNTVVDHFALDAPKREGNFGYMFYPNVTFNGNYVIYNYPFESRVNILDMATGLTRTVNPISSIAPGEVEEFKGESVNESGWYGAENYFYSPLYYLQGSDCYVRVTLGRTDLDRTNNDCDKAYYDRPFYLTKFDRDFRPMAEYELTRHKYNPFGGWVPLYDSIAFYSDNMFNEPDSQNVTLDLILANEGSVR